jgi:hypothetical protein
MTMGDAGCTRAFSFVAVSICGGRMTSGEWSVGAASSFPYSVLAIRHLLNVQSAPWLQLARELCLRE